MHRYFGWGRGLYGPLPTNFYEKPSRPPKRTEYEPTGNVKVDGFTRYSRHDPYGYPGDFVSAKEADRIEKIEADNDFDDA